MIRFTKGYVNTISLIISIIVFCFSNSFIISIKKIDSKPLISNNEIQTNVEKVENNSVQEETKEEKEQKEQELTANWMIKIPQINLIAEVSEGTTKEVMDVYVGHFEETPKINGNVGLAAHNRGYKVNYFSDVKKLKEGDKIIYKYENETKEYRIKTIKIIKDTDWSYLENTEENKITLITCVENEPEYRRCVQGIEEKEREELN